LKEKEREREEEKERVMKRIRQILKKKRRDVDEKEGPIMTKKEFEARIRKERKNKSKM